MIIIYHKNFTKAFKKLATKEKDKVKERLSLFKDDEFNPILNNHLLKGKYLGYRSINIKGDLRAVYKFTQDSVIFVTIDNHSNLYG